MLKLCKPTLTWATIALAVILCVALRGASQAQPAGQPPAAPAAPTTNAVDAGTEHLQLKITGAEGLAFYRVPPGAWTKCVVGMVVDEGAEFRTGPGSAVRFTIPPDQTITLDRLGVVKVIDAIKQQGKVITNCGLLHGRVRLDIEAAGVEHQSVIRSPNGTLAVRGTSVSLYDQAPFPVEAISLTGRAQFGSAKGQTAFGGKGAGKLKVAAGKSAADVLLSNAVVDPTITYARTQEEQQLLADVISRGSLVTLQLGGIPIVSGGTPPATDRQLRAFQRGQLEFVLRWTGNADLNLGIGDPRGGLMFPVTGLNSTQSGGFIPFNHIGGPNGGFEIAYWTGRFPSGFYAAFIQYISGVTTQYTLDVFKNGTRTTILDPLGNPVNTYTSTAGPNQNGLVFVPIGIPAPPVPLRKQPSHAPSVSLLAQKDTGTNSVPTNANTGAGNHMGHR